MSLIQTYSRKKDEGNTVSPFLLSDEAKAMKISADDDIFSCISNSQFNIYDNQIIMPKDSQTMVTKEEYRMKTLVLASNNAHKLEEIRAILGNDFDIKSLNDIGCYDDIPETGATFRDNALQKAKYVKEHFGYDCFADDSGLEVEALNGEPGVFSARYAAKNGHTPSAADKDNANMDTLLQKLASLPASQPSAFSADSHPTWKACFRTSIALIYAGEEHFFDGIVNGRIITEKRGTGGFGYDPIFIPEGYDQTFAELGNDVKNGISHRARAVAKLAQFLKA